MAHHKHPKLEDRPSDHWGHTVAQWTFWFTATSAALFFGYVLFVIIL